MRQSFSSALGMWGLQLSNVGWMTLWLSGQNIASIQGQTHTEPSLLLQYRTVGTLESRFLLLLESASHPSVCVASVVILTDLSAACLCSLSHCELQKTEKKRPFRLETATASLGSRCRRRRKQAKQRREGGSNEQERASYVLIK